MAKIAFSKLKLNKDEMYSSAEVQFNDKLIEIKKYLPVGEKMLLTAKVINLSADENNFFNPIKLDVYLALEIIFRYAGISFTEKQMEDLPKLYDSIKSSGLLDLIISNIPSEEYETVKNGVREISDKISDYRNSALGILETVSSDYSNLKLDASDIQKEIGNPNNLALLREILTTLG